LTALPTRPVPAAGVWRLHRDPEQLPPASEHPGDNRYDDPRRNADGRFLVRYLATSLRGCALEALAWLRPDEEAKRRTEDVVGEDGDDARSLADAVADFLATRKVARCSFPEEVRFADIHAPATLAFPDTDLNVEPLLAAPRGRAVLGDGLHRPHLDQAGVLLASAFGRDVTRHASLAVWDLDPPYSGIAYRSRHDLVEWCWAAFDRTPVEFMDPVVLSRHVEEHREAVRDVAELWQLPLHRWLVE